jgi:hypothetical protein
LDSNENSEQASFQNVVLERDQLAAMFEQAPTFMALLSGPELQEDRWRS